ncbi:MAG TPA: tetratricopeptide repeat protein, partial [Gemmataceae bacterium]|nr:tetratricopeptide repeat protein [Gemmataceae bacterium]
MRRHLNLRLSACLLAIVALLGVAVHFVHGYQVKRNAATLLEQANLAKQDGNQEDEHIFLARYLGFVPNDTAVLVRYGLLLDDTARHDNKKVSWLGQAYLVYHQVLHLDPANEEVRRRVAKLALDIRRYPDALDQLSKLLVTHPNDAELQAELGRGEEGVGDFKKAAEAYDTARKLDPTDLISYGHLAALNRQQLANPSKADRVIADMVKNNPRSAQARVMRAQYWLAFPGTDSSALQRAEEDLKAARQLSLPQDEAEKSRVEADIMITSARVAEAKGERQEARHWLQEGLKRQPTNEALFLELVTVELKDNQLDKARDWALAGQKALPGDKNLLYSLAEVRLRRGELGEVESLLKELKTAGYDESRTGLLDATLLVAQNQWAPAAKELEDLRAQFSQSPEQASRLNMLLAQCQGALGNPDQALLAYESAVSLNPLNIPARLGLAATLQSLGRQEQAIAAYRQLLDLKNAPAEARLRLCEALIVQNLRAPAKERNWNAVKAELQQAARQMPDAPAVTLLQAEVLVQEDPNQVE